MTEAGTPGRGQQQTQTDSNKEELIRAYRPQIAAIASAVCGRRLDWTNDDELSIALLAFAEAVDSFDPSRGPSLLSHARLVIHRRLVDYFRQEGRQRFQSLEPPAEEAEEAGAWEIQAAWERYRAEEEARQQEETVQAYRQALGQYGLTLEELVRASPQHRDTRQNLLRAAACLAADRGMAAYLERTRRLPLKELALATGLSRKVLDSGRRYILAVALVLLRPELEDLRNFLDLDLTGKGGGGSGSGES